MSGRCHDCAFTKGTEANAADHTTAQAFLCVLAHEPFYCHVNLPPGGPPLLCAGYVEASRLFAPAKPNRMVGMVADMLAECIRLAAGEDTHEPPPAATTTAGGG